MSELEAEFGQEEEKVKIAKMKQKLKLTWEDAAVVGQIENEKVKQLNFINIFSIILKAG